MNGVRSEIQSAGSWLRGELRVASIGRARSNRSLHYQRRSPSLQLHHARAVTHTSTTGKHFSNQV